MLLGTDSGNFPNWGEDEDHGSGWAFFGHLAEIVRCSCDQAFMGNGVDSVYAFVDESVGELAAFAVKPIGIQIDGADFCGVDARHEHESEG